MTCANYAQSVTEGKPQDGEEIVKDRKGYGEGIHDGTHEHLYQTTFFFCF